MATLMGLLPPAHTSQGFTPMALPTNMPQCVTKHLNFYSVYNYHEETRNGNLLPLTTALNIPCPLFTLWLPIPARLCVAGSTKRENERRNIKHGFVVNEWAVASAGEAWVSRRGRRDIGPPLPLLATRIRSKEIMREMWGEQRRVQWLLQQSQSNGYAEWFSWKFRGFMFPSLFLLGVVIVVVVVGELISDCE